MPGQGRVLDPFDLGGELLLLIAVGAEPLSVVEAGGASAGDGDDVVVLADLRIAERSAAGGVAPAEEASHRGREGPRGGVHRDELVGCGMGVEASQRRPHVLAVGAEGIALPRSGRGRAGQELLAHRLGRHGAVALEVGDVACLR